MILGCVVLATASLAVPAALGYDPWAWLVWGREVGRLSLDTTGGASWKPLPVLLTTPMGPLGGAAPTIWMVTARAAGLLAVVGVGRVAARLAGPAAGWIAAGLLLLTPDTEARYLRLVAEGHSAPLTVALASWACERHLAGRPRAALLLSVGLALDRPEAWPFVGLYMAWLWWSRPQERPVVALAAVAVPLLWFGGDWWGSGRPWHGAELAQVDTQDTDRVPTSLTRAADAVPVVVWLAAAAGVALAMRARDRAVLVIAGAAACWMALVVTMAVVLGYAAVGRFQLPAAAVLCVLASVGVVWTVAAIPPGQWRKVATAAVVAVAVASLLPRVSALPRLADEVAARAGTEDDLDGALDRAGGPASLAADCPRIVTDEASSLRIALAWKLDLPLGGVDHVARPVRGPAVAIVHSGGRLDRAYGRELDRAPEVSRTGRWAIYAVDCPRAARRAR